MEVNETRVGGTGTKAVFTQEEPCVKVLRKREHSWLAEVIKVKTELQCKSLARGKIREMDRSLRAFETMYGHWTSV